MVFRKLRFKAKVFLSIVLSAILVMPSFVVFADEKEINSNLSNTYELTDASSYLSYYNKYKTAEIITDNIILTASNLLGCENNESVGINIDEESVKLDNNNTWAEWSFAIEKAGLYSVTPDYLCFAGTDNDVTFSLCLDGKIPYNEAENFEIPRFWADDGVVEKDEEGNDLRPKQTEVYEWNTQKIWNTQGLYEEPYQLYLSEGTHTIRINYLEEPFAIRSIALGNEAPPVDYENYISKYSSSDYTIDQTVHLQAEDAFKKNKMTLYRTYDNASPATLPNDVNHIRLNTIGQSTWKEIGDTIYWEVPDCEEGLYAVSFRARQNLQFGMTSFRTLRINGEIPFKEAQMLGFEYKSDWYIKTLGDDQPLYIYLKAGDILSLECVPGPTSNIMSELQNNINELNELYRKIMIITGSSPDVNRDYSLETQIPGLEEMMIKLSKKLDSLYETIEKKIQTSGSQASSIKEMSLMLQELAARPTTIPERFNSFKASIESLSSLLLLLQEQPLELDYITFTSKGEEIPSGKVNVFESIWFSIRRLIASFVNNGEYNPDASKKEMTVWVSTGRDQSQIIWRLISEKYESESNCAIKLNLVDTGDTLIKATLAGKGPDIALMIPKDKPVNLAMRNALVDLSDYDFSELKANTFESAWTPFYYKNGLYAVPESENFDVLFYRTDIFEQLELKVPNTWDDYFDVVKKLQSKNFEVGMPEIDSANQGVSLGIGVFNRFLFQNGETYYNSDFTKTNFSSQISNSAFKNWTQLYTVYGLERSFDLFSRFRSGDMPMGIQGYTFYNQLMQAAPEIRGLWSFAPVPGTLKSNGEIDRSQSTNITASIILKSAEKKGITDEAVDFVKWWTSAETQSEYAKELEATLGVAARYTPANREAFLSLSWSGNESKMLMEQWAWSKNVREIPGNYMISRSLTNALRETISGKNGAYRSLAIYDDVINDEIERKLQEFK